MDWPEALDLVITHTRHEHYRTLCADAHPNHVAWRMKVIAKAASLAGMPAPAFPPIRTQAGNLAGALFAWAVSGFSTASAEEQARRLDICRACPEWDGSRCRKCGCYTAAKVRMKTEHCPMSKW